jgi:hypothetical protein
MEARGSLLIKVCKGNGGDWRHEARDPSYGVVFVAFSEASPASCIMGHGNIEIQFRESNEAMG